MSKCIAHSKKNTTNNKKIPPPPKKKKRREKKHITKYKYLSYRISPRQNNYSDFNELAALDRSISWTCYFQLLTNVVCIILNEFYLVGCIPGSAFIKPDQLDPGIKDQIKITLLPTISHLQLLNFVSCARACPSHMTQNLVTVGAKLWTAECFLFDPWSMDQADLVW